MADKDQHARRLQWLSARKSALVSAGGVNARRLVLLRQASKEEEEEEEEEEEIETSNNECGNLFCRQILANRYAKYCEDKPICQRYRALKLQCLANAQAEEDEEDRRLLSLVIKREKGKEKEKKEEEKEEENGEEKEEKKKKKKKKKKEKKKNKTDGAFEIPRMNSTKELSIKNSVGKKKLNLNVNASMANKKRKRNSSSPGQVNILRKVKKREMEKKLYEEKEKKRRSKRVKRAQKEAAESKKTDISVVINNSSNVQGPSDASSDEHGLHTKRQKNGTLSLVRQSTETSSDAETGIETSNSRTKRRRMSVDTVSARAAPSSPIGAASVASPTITNWKIPKGKPDQARTSVQAIRRNMSVDLVPLGVANRTNFAGGRYVQNGNRSAVVSLRPSDPRPRPPSMTKFPAPAVSAPTSASMLNASSRPAQRTEQTALPHTQRPLPPLPPQAALLAPPVPQPTATAVTPLAPPVESPAIRHNPNSFTTTEVPEITRISTTDYLKCRRGDSGRQQPGKETDHQPSRSSSIERLGSLGDDRAQRVFPAPAYPTGPPGYHRSDRAPLSSYTVSYSAVDSRKQNPESEGRHQRSHLGIEERYRERSEVRGECKRSTSGQREFRNFPPSRDHYPSRHQDLSQNGISSSDNDYAFDTHVDSASSLPEPSYWRGPTQEEPPPPQRVPRTRQSEQHVKNKLRNFGYDDLEEDVPTFSHQEDFLPQLLSVFIRKLPQSLEAVFNVTKKPRKMNWYVTYVKRIEHICKAFDLHVKFDGLKAAVTVRGREWLTLQSTSTVSLHLNVIRSLRAEAVTWLRLSEEMESAFDYYKGIYGSQINESISFLRAWNELKHTGNYISLPRETNYFCGARLHHWNFVVGKVEIGSGSHEEKREAFRLATVSALEFLLSIGRRERSTAVKREGVLEEVPFSTREQHRSSSRESSMSSTSLATETENGLSPILPSAGLPSSVEPPLPAAQPSSVVRPTEHRTVARNFADTPSAEATSTIKHSTTNGLQLPADAPLTGETDISTGTLTYPTSVVRTEKTDVVSTPVTISNSSHRLAGAAERSDSCDELTITDASDMSALTTARSPRRSIVMPSNPPAGSLESAATLAATTTQATAPPLSVPAAEISTSLTTEAERKAPTAMLATPVATFGVSADKDIPATQANAVVPPRRCMMCEMICMRKPDGERCLRCQQNDAPANGVLRTLRGP